MQTHTRAHLLAAFPRSRVPRAVRGRARLLAPAAGHVLQLQGREQLVDREAAGAGVVGSVAPARRRAARRRGAAAARHHEPRAQLARRRRARLAAVTGNLCW